MAHYCRLTILTTNGSIWVVIESFADEQTAAVFDGIEVRRLPGQIQPIARRKLKMIDAAARLDELRVPPGNRLEALKGKRKGQWSIRVNDQWRICFQWADGAAREVAIVDYH
jgi:toxin HigB-1